MANTNGTATTTTTKMSLRMIQAEHRCSLRAVRHCVLGADRTCTPTLKPNAQSGTACERKRVNVPDCVAEHPMQRHRAMTRSEKLALTACALIVASAPHAAAFPNFARKFKM